ncbi:MAG: hypothetical protein K0R18_3042 [Bacillales bacterium]|nr:hypothetical protein [Bacillales bacterium]
MLIPGFLISIVTFPGIIVHELAHQIFCWIMKVPVFEVKYFQLKNPCGYVIHEATEKPLANFMISIGPFFVNTVLGCIIAFPGLFFTKLDSNSGALSAWLGISILMHAFPSKGDGQAMVDSILKNDQVNTFTKILTAPVIGLVYIGALGSMFWLDAIYAGFVGLGFVKMVGMFF